MVGTLPGWRRIMFRVIELVVRGPDVPKAGGPHARH